MEDSPEDSLAEQTLKGLGKTSLDSLSRLHKSSIISESIGDFYEALENNRDRVMLVLGQIVGTLMKIGSVSEAPSVDISEDEKGLILLAALLLLEYSNIVIESVNADTTN